MFSDIGEVLLAFLEGERLPDGQETHTSAAEFQGRSISCHESRDGVLSLELLLCLSVGREVPKTQYPYVYQTWVVGSLGTVELVIRTVLAELAAKSKFLTPTPAPANIRDMLFSSWGTCGLLARRTNDINHGDPS